MLKLEEQKKKKKKKKKKEKKKEKERNVMNVGTAGRWSEISRGGRHC